MDKRFTISHFKIWNSAEATEKKKQSLLAAEAFVCVCVMESLISKTCSIRPPPNGMCWMTLELATVSRDSQTHRTPVCLTTPETPLIATKYYYMCFGFIPRHKCEQFLWLAPNAHNSILPTVSTQWHAIEQYQLTLILSQFLYLSHTNTRTHATLSPHLGAKCRRRNVDVE